VEIILNSLSKNDTFTILQVILKKQSVMDLLQKIRVIFE